MVSDWIKADCFENTVCWYEDHWIRLSLLLSFLLVWRMENRKEFRWTNRGRFESEHRDQFHIVICTYSYHQTDIWKSREQWYLTTKILIHSQWSICWAYQGIFEVVFLYGSCFLLCRRSGSHPHTKHSLFCC